MDIYKITVIETVEKTFEIAVESVDSPWTTAERVYEEENDNLPSRVVGYKIKEIILDS